MDFIERLFGVAPDAGNGSLEAIYVLTIATILATVVQRPLARLILRIKSRKILSLRRGGIGKKSDAPPRRRKDTSHGVNFSHQNKTRKPISYCVTISTGKPAIESPDIEGYYGEKVIVPPSKNCACQNGQIGK